MLDHGKAYTKGSSFRALAERQQRRYRAEVLKVKDDGEWGHRLCAMAAKAGRNYLSSAIYQAVLERAEERKGIDVTRTSGNMLSSQAMCFNVFAPLDNDEGRKVLARVLAKYAGGMGVIRRMHFEYTPSSEVFNDQSAVGGVDCDLLIEFENGVLGIETKFVEEEFSRCGFCKSATTRKCPAGENLDASKCLYTKKKGYHYWEQTHKLGTLKQECMSGDPCPFDGPMWQLWVNHTLVQAEAKKRKVSRGVFAVCAPEGNEALRRTNAVDEFRALLTDPGTFAFIPLEKLIGELKAELAAKAEWSEWIYATTARYVVERSAARGSR